MTSGSVLVVDDCQQVASTVAAILRMGGYATETAASGQEALDRVEQYQPRLVLLDLRMPILDGISVAREIRAREAAASIPPVKIIVMSAAPDAWVDAARMQADGWLIKPFGMDELLSEVARLSAP